jgi:hypothetical protein
MLPCATPFAPLNPPTTASTPHIGPPTRRALAARPHCAPAPTAPLLLRAVINYNRISAKQGVATEIWLEYHRCDRNYGIICTA